VKDPPLFEEEQRFRQPWLWGILAGAAGLAGWAAAKRESSWFGPAITASVLAAVYAMKLLVQVDSKEVRIHFFPLPRRTIPLGEIRACEARTYRPIREYGGWGIRYGFSGMAYNVSGDRGVQLELHNGKRILIGSQRAEELAAVINHARQALAKS
jgi:hypothetical protein